MDLKTASHNILIQLDSLVDQLSQDDFCKPIDTLGGSTIGQHLRHTLEFFICLQAGVVKGSVNYDKREHDKLIESDKVIAVAALQGIKKFIDSHHENTELKLEVGYDVSKEQFVTVDTNYARELVYNIEHAVHHMAIMKIGIHQAAPYVKLPHDFGIAASTIRYQEALQVTQ